MSTSMEHNLSQWHNSYKNIHKTYIEPIYSQRPMQLDLVGGNKTLLTVETLSHPEPASCK